MNIQATSLTTTCDNTCDFTITTTGDTETITINPSVYTNTWVKYGHMDRGTYEIMNLINSIIPNYGASNIINYINLNEKEYYKAAKNVLYALCWIETYKDKNGK